MDPTTSFVLALVAIVVAAGSALFAGISVYQTKKYRPKADLKVTWEKNVTWNDQPAIPLTYATITNHGDGVAREVEMTLDNATLDGSDHWSEIPVIAPGEQVQVLVPLWRNVTADADAFLSVHEVPAVTVFPSLTVSWRKESGTGRKQITQLIEGDGWKAFGQ
jgi:hypothetical protein